MDRDDAKWTVVEVDAPATTKTVATLESLQQGQAELALSMQQLLSGMHVKLEALSLGLQTLAVHVESGNINTRVLASEVQKLQQLVTSVEDKVVEKSVRDVNKKLRSHQSFVFNSQKNHPY